MEIFTQELLNNVSFKDSRLIKKSRHESFIKFKELNIEDTQYTTISTLKFEKPSQIQDGNKNLNPFILDINDPQNEEVIKEFFDVEIKDKLSAMTLAFFNHCIFISVPENIDAGTIKVENLKFENEYKRIIIVAGKNSKVTIVEEQNSNKFFSEHVMVYAKSDSDVKYFAFQNLPQTTNAFIIRQAHLENDAKLSWVICSNGSSTLKSTTDAILLGQGASAQYSELFLTNNSQHYDIVSNLHHLKNNTKGDVLVKGLLKDKSRSVFQGMIKIDKNATQSDSFLSEHTILLSKDARSDAIPALEIETNDVRCTHSASMGQIDEEQIFYLESRGIPRDEAKKQIAIGFLMPVINRITDEEMKNKLLEEINKKWDNG